MDGDEYHVGEQARHKIEYRPRAAARAHLDVANAEFLDRHVGHIGHDDPHTNGCGDGHARQLWAFGHLGDDGLCHVVNRPLEPPCHLMALGADRHAWRWHKRLFVEVLLEELAWVPPLKKREGRGEREHTEEGGERAQTRDPARELAREPRPTGTAHLYHRA
eukprot:scaffold243541_cov32-Tisochrysis_lutea.AAC.1